MNKHDLIKMENNKAMGMKEYAEITDFALDCIEMQEYDWAKRAISLLNAELVETIQVGGSIHVD